MVPKKEICRLEGKKEGEKKGISTEREKTPKGGDKKEKECAVSKLGDNSKLQESDRKGSFKIKKKDD